MSTMGDWAYWLAGLGVLAINAALVYVAWWALFSDRAKGRRRCPKCWYDMAYSPTMTCAECGHTPRNEKQFARTRRRYGFATAAILASVVLSLFVTDRITERGFTAMLPSRVLLWFLPLVDERNGLYTELTERARYGQLSEGNWSALVQRSVNGDSWARPPSDAWVKKYGNFLLNVRISFIKQPEVEKLLLTIPPQVQVTTREVWPRDMPVTLGVQVRDWWPWGMECRVRAQPRVEGKDIGEPVTFYRNADSRFQRTPFSLHLPPLNEIDSVVTSIEVDFQIDRRRLPVRANGVIEWNDEDPLEEEWEPVTKQQVHVKTKAEGDLEHIAKAVNDEAMNDMMMQAFGEGVVRWMQGRSPVRFNVTAPITFLPPFDDTVVGVTAELQRDGVVARRLNMWWLAGTAPNLSHRLSDRNYGFEVHFEDIELLRKAGGEGEDGRWQIHVRSDPQIALRAGAAPKYWQGEFTIPLKLQIREEAAPPRPWRVHP